MLFAPFSSGNSHYKGRNKEHSGIIQKQRAVLEKSIPSHLIWKPKGGYEKRKKNGKFFSEPFFMLRAYDLSCRYGSLVDMDFMIVSYAYGCMQFADPQKLSIGQCWKPLWDIPCQGEAALDGKECLTCILQALSNAQRDVKC